MGAKLAVIAHRGASALAPENTAAAFRRALELGVDAIETDVRAARDGGLVLCHDADLARIAGRPERVADLDLDTLRGIVVGTDATDGPQTIATPGELFGLTAGRTRVLLDLKLPPGTEGAVLEAIAQAGVERATIVGVRSVAALRAFATAAPQLATLAFGRTPDEVWAMAEAGASIVRLWSPWVDDAALARADRLGTPVWVMCGAPSVGSVGEATVEEVVAYRRMGIAGVILNDPRLALAANAEGAGG